jgi:MoxR-like ATPase
VLLEGDVGVGKTTVLRAFARAVGGDFERVEGTVDLMPNDLVYHTYVDSDGKPRIEPGPLLRHGERLTTFFFNEINRARPQVQSLLLRAMAERTRVGVQPRVQLPAHDGVRRPQPRRARRNLRTGVGGARPLHVRTAHADAGRRRGTRRALVFDTALPRHRRADRHGHARMLDWMQMNTIGRRDPAGRERVGRAAALRDGYLGATSDPAEVRHVQIDGVDMSRLMLAGASPRGMSACCARCACRGLDGRPRLPDAGRRAAVLPSTLVHRVFFTPVYEMRRSELADALVSQMLERVATP